MPNTKDRCIVSMIGDYCSSSIKRGLKDMKHYAKYTADIEHVENYELALKDNFKGWDCHHRLETHNSDGERRLVGITKKELIALEMYYGRPAEELIFMKRKDHLSLHYKGRNLSSEIKKKMSETRKGRPKSEEWRKKHSEALKGKKYSKETKKKRSADAN